MEVDKYDNPIGFREKKEFYSGKYIHRGVHLILFNSKNEILLQRRAPDKFWFPDLYSYSVSGGVENETYEEVMKREAREEIGVEIKPSLLFIYKFFQKNDKGFHAVFYEKYDGNIKADKREISEIKWIEAIELYKDITKNPEKYTPPFIRGMKIFFNGFYDKELKKPILL